MSRENSKIFPPYYLGLDIGTESIGSAITDPHYQVLRIAGKPTLSVRLFETANTAVDRRGFRTAHRRIKRRRDRILWLRELLGEEIAKVDASFLYRLDNSDLHKEDKEDENNPHPTKGKYSLFYGDYTDVDYYRDFPTVYHLRKAWMDDTVAKKDIRLFYLAVQHIIKYRGNFLREGEEFGDGFLSFSQIKTSWDNAVAAYRDEWEEGFEGISFSEITFGALEEGKRILRWDLTEEELASEKFKKTAARRKAFAKWVGLTAKQEEGFVKFILGDKVNPNALFGKGSYEKEDFENYDVTAGKFDEWKTEWAQKLSDGQYQLVLAAMDGYRWQSMVFLLNGHEYISDAMIEKYEQHKKDLRLFKDYLKEINRKDIYSRVFFVAKDTKEGDKEKEGKETYLKNYALYQQGDKKCSKEDLYDFIKKVLADLPDPSGKKAEILSRIEKDTFLSRLNTSDNGVFPYQLHLAELKKILKTGKKHFPMLDEKIAGAKEEYDTVAKRILSILTYRIPYYVGPLQCATDEKPGFGWVVRKEGKIRPWTYHDLVDEGESGKRFIRNMTAKCTYLPQFNVLPKNSLLFSEYLVLNELNKLRVNDELLTLEQKKSIIDNLYCNPTLKGKITAKKIKDFLRAGDKNAEIKLSNFGEELQGDMKSYRTFASKLGKEKLNRPEIREAVEKFIEYATVFESGKDAMVHFSSCDEAKLFSDDEKEWMGSLTYGGWGRLSKELLELELTDPKSGEIRSVIEILRETNYNLMQILTSKEAGFDFELARQKMMGEEPESEVGYDALKEEYCSPSVRRSVWQTILVVREYVKETGALPQKVFIEVTREHERNKGAVKSRHADLLQKYKDWWKGEKVSQWEIREKLKEELEGRRQENLQEDKLYLYYRQLGKCMYTLEDIDLSRLEQDYDIDHIIPQALLKDDSLVNRVLVKKVANEEKKDIYPLPPKFQTQENKLFWKALKEGELISEETYKRLTRKTKLTDEELNAFIARQLVETAQAATLAAKWLKKEFASYLEQQGGGVMPEIVLSKAGNVSEFRKQFDLFKVRDLNDCHHAHDAYLNIVVGNVMNEKYSHAPDGQRDTERPPEEEKMDKFESRTWNFEKTFQKGVWSYREKEYVWRPYGENGTLDTVKKVLKLRDFPVTKMEITGTGSFYDQNRNKKGNIQVKEDGLRSKVEKYGGYRGTSPSYFIVAEVRRLVKGSMARSVHFVPVTIYHQNRIAQGRLSTLEYLSGIFGCPKGEISIICPKLKRYSLLEIDGTKVRLSGYSNDNLVTHNANEAWFTTETQRYVKELLLVKGKAIKWCNGKDAKKMNEAIGFLEEDKMRRLNNETTHRKEKARIVLLSKDANLKVYLELLEKMEKPPYCNLQTYAKYAREIRAGQSAFEALSLYEQMDVIANLLQFFRCGTMNLSLKPIGGSNTINAIKPSMDITKKIVYYIAESVCGFRSKRIPLNVPEKSGK